MRQWNFWLDEGSVKRLMTSELMMIKVIDWAQKNNKRIEALTPGDLLEAIKSKA